MANVFCLNGGPARAPICRRVRQDAPQRRPKTPPSCPKTPPRRPKKPQEASKTRCRWFLGPKMPIENMKIPALGFQQSSLSTKTNVLPTAAQNEPKALQNTHGRPKTLPGCPKRRIIRRTFVYYTDYNEKFLRAMGGG